MRVSALGVVAGRSPALDADAGGERFSRHDAWTHEVQGYLAHKTHPHP